MLIYFLLIIIIVIIIAILINKPIHGGLMDRIPDEDFTIFKKMIINLGEYVNYQYTHYPIDLPIELEFSDSDDEYKDLLDHVKTLTYILDKYKIKIRLLIEHSPMVDGVIKNSTIPVDQMVFNCKEWIDTVLKIFYTNIYDFAELLNRIPNPNLPTLLLISNTNKLIAKLEEIWGQPIDNDMRRRAQIVYYQPNIIKYITIRIKKFPSHMPTSRYDPNNYIQYINSDYYPTLEQLNVMIAYIENRGRYNYSFVHNRVLPYVGFFIKIYYADIPKNVEFINNLLRLKKVAYKLLIYYEAYHRHVERSDYKTFLTKKYKNMGTSIGKFIPPTGIIDNAYRRAVGVYENKCFLILNASNEYYPKPEIQVTSYISQNSRHNTNIIKTLFETMNSALKLNIIVNREDPVPPAEPLLKKYYATAAGKKVIDSLKNYCDACDIFAPYDLYKFYKEEPLMRSKSPYAFIAHFDSARPINIHCASFYYESAAVGNNINYRHQIVTNMWDNILSVSEFNVFIKLDSRQIDIGCSFINKYTPYFKHLLSITTDNTNTIIYKPQIINSFNIIKKSKHAHHVKTMATLYQDVPELICTFLLPRGYVILLRSE